MLKNVEYKSMFQRNIGVITQKDQDKIEKSVVSIAGVGGDGGLIAETLARLGVGEIRVADPETFEISNINRQNGSSTAVIGENKAEVIADIVRKINPYCVVKVYNHGVTKDNVAEFIKGSSILIDESEFTRHEIALMLSRKAREHNIPLITGLNIGYGAIVLSFTPTGTPFEKYLGFDKNRPVEEMADGEVKIYKWCPWLPPYVDIDVFKKVADKKIPVPGISPSVALVSSLVSTEVLLYLTGKKRLIEAPKYIWADLYQRKLKVRRANAFMFYISLVKMVFFAKIKKNNI